MDREAVEAALDDIRDAFRADGADIVVESVDPATDSVSVRLDLADVSCLECVLAPDILHNIIEAALSRALTTEFELIVTDPRVGAG
jgi:Fe-S cluster biogenesis protein NfuA